MNRCSKKIDIDCRWFISSAGAAATGAAAVTHSPAQAAAVASAASRVEYQSNCLAKVADLEPNEPLEISYLDGDFPGCLIKLGSRVASARTPSGWSAFKQLSA